MNSDRLFNNKVFVGVFLFVCLLSFLFCRMLQYYNSVFLNVKDWKITPPKSLLREITSTFPIRHLNKTKLSLFLTLSPAFARGEINLFHTFLLLSRSLFNGQISIWIWMGLLIIVL